MVNMKISIIVPIYNVEGYVKECIYSLCNQTIKDIEILVIDDGSTDRSIDIIKKIKDERIKIITKKNGGLSSARNKGIENAKGDYIAFVDSDDFIGITTAYEDMYNIAIKEESDIVSGNCIWYYSKENNYPLERDMSKFSYSPMKSEDFLLESIKSDRIYTPVWLNLYSTDFILNNKLFFKEGFIHEDEDFTPRAILKANKVSIYNKDFYMYRQRGGSIMHNINEKFYIDMLEICLGLEREVDNINNDELKDLFRNRIAKTAILAIYQYKPNNISKEIKELIKRNAINRKNKIRSGILNINTNLYLKTEDIFQSLKSHKSV